MSFLKSKSRLFIANIEHYINFDWYKYKLELYNQIKYIKLKKAFEFSYILNWFRDCKRPDRDRLILSVKTDYFVKIHEKITICILKRHLDANMICVCVITTITIKIIPLRIILKSTTLGFFIHTYENNKVNANM